MSLIVAKWKKPIAVRYLYLSGMSSRFQAAFLWMSIGSAIALPMPALAQLPRLPANTQAPTQEVFEETDPIEQATPQSDLLEGNRVELNLPDLINIVIQGNRDLKNSVLERVVQRQTLNQEESVFSPRLTPNFSLRAERNFSDSSSIGDIAEFDDGTDGFDESDRTTVDESFAVSSTLKTPLGTELELSIDPVDGDSPVNFTVNQPLLRGAGRTVNQAPVQQARIIASNNALELQQQVIDTVTTSVTQYTTLVRNQEAVVIQAQALERRRQQFEIVNALVEAGRQARVDLIDSERSIAEAELGLQDASNQLSQANTDLLNLIGAETRLRFVAPENAISQLFDSAASRVSKFQLDQLIETAYQMRPDYQQAKANIEVEDLGLLLAEDDQRWRLDWQSSARLGSDASQTTTGLQFTRTFGDESLDTAVERSRTNVLQRQNTLAQLAETIGNQVTDRFGDVNSGLAQVRLAQQATEAAQLQLQVTKEKFKLGRDGITLFDISQQEEALVNAQNTELQARISFINSIAELDKSVGLTLDTWQSSVDFSPVLAEERIL